MGEKPLGTQLCRDYMQAVDFYMSSMSEDLLCGLALFNLLYPSLKLCDLGIRRVAEVDKERLSECTLSYQYFRCWVVRNVIPDFLIKVSTFKNQ